MRSLDREVEDSKFIPHPKLIPEKRIFTPMIPLKRRTLKPFKIRPIKIIETAPADKPFRRAA